MNDWLYNEQHVSLNTCSTEYPPYTLLLLARFWHQSRVRIAVTSRANEMLYLQSVQMLRNSNTITGLEDDMKRSHTSVGV
jgi:hypothetical protein